MGGNSSKESDTPRLSDYTKNARPQDIVDALKSAEEKLLMQATDLSAESPLSLGAQLEDIVTLITWDKAYQESDLRAIQCLAVQLLNVALANSSNHIQLLELLRRNRQTLATICKLSLEESKDLGVHGVKCLALLCPLLEKEEIVDFGMIRILILAAAASDEAIKSHSLNGLKELAAGFSSEILAASGLPTLIEVLKDKDNISQQEIALEILAVMAENSAARAELVTVKYMDIVKSITERSTNQGVQGDAMWLIGTLCKHPEARAFFRSNIHEVIKLAKTASDDAVRRKAKSALLALSFDDENEKVIESKHALELALSMFSNLSNHGSQLRAASLLRNISEECVRQSLLKLFRRLVTYSAVLLREQDPNVYEPVLGALANFAMRFDLQPDIGKQVGIVEELITKDGEIAMREKKNDSALKVLCLLTVNPLNDSFYANPMYLNFLLNAQRSESEVKKQLAKLTLAGANADMVNVEEASKVQQLAILSRSEDPVVACRAAGTFSLLALSMTARSALLHFNVVEAMVALLRNPHPMVAIQAALALDTFTRSPHDLELWLKFDSTFVIDAASLHLPRFHEKVVRLHSGRGLFSNWGMVPRETDIISIVNLPRLADWTLSVWFVRPNIDKPGQMTLVEGAKTKARIFISEGELRLQASTGTEHILVSLKKTPKGWHHLAIARHSQGSVTVYLDGVRKQFLDRVDLSDEWKYFCNAQFGRQPFAPLCDLRLYRKHLDESDIRDLHRVNINSDANLPDSDIDVITSAGAVLALKSLLSLKVEYARTAAAATLSNLATKESARREIIRSTVLPEILKQLQSKNDVGHTDTGRIEVGRLLVNIA